MTKKGLLLGVALLASLAGARDARAFIEVCVSVTGRTFTLTLLPCQAGETLITWGDSGPPGPPGPMGPQGVPGPAAVPPPDPPPLGAASFMCSGFGWLPPMQPMYFSGPMSGNGQGAIGPASTAQGAVQFTSWILQPGLYRVSFELQPGGASWNNMYLMPYLNGVQVPLGGVSTIPTFGGTYVNGNPAANSVEGLITVTAPNTTLQFIQANTPQGLSATTGDCQVVIEQLQ